MYDTRQMYFDKDSSLHNISNLSDKKDYHFYQRDLLAELNQSQQRLTVQELENKVVMLATENERLMSQLNDKNREIEFLQEEQRMLQNAYQSQKDDRYRTIENRTTKMIYENEKVVLMNQSLQIQLEELSYQYESLQKKFQVETEMIEQKWKAHYGEMYEQQNKNLTVNIEKLLNELKQNSDLIQSYEEKLKSCSKELQMAKEQLDYKDKKGNELLSNNQQISNILEQQDAVIKKNSEKISQLQIQLEQQVNENRQQKQKLINLEKDIESRRIKYEELIIQFEELKLLEKEERLQLEKNDQEFQQYKLDINQMKSNLNELNRNHKLQQQENQNNYNMEINHLKKQIQQVIMENEDLQKLLNQTRQNLNNEINKTTTLEKQLADNAQDIQIKEQQLLMQYKELEAQKLKFDKLFQENTSYLKQQQNQFDIKLLQNQQQNKLQTEQILQQKNKEVNNLNDRINVLLQKIDEQASYIQQLSYQSNIKGEEIEETRPQIQSLRNELHRLQQLTVEQSNEIDNWKLKTIRMEENYEMQNKDQLEKLQRFQDEIQQLQTKLHKTQEENIKITNNLQETLSNLNQIQQLLSETHQQLKFAENRIEIQSQELAETSQLREQLGLLKEKHQKEIEALKKAVDSSLKVKIEKEIAQEREKLENYSQQITLEKRSLENVIQNLNTENQLLKTEIMQQQEYFKLQVQDLIVDQQKYLINIDHVYKLELKGLSEAQQIQYNQFVVQLHSQIATLTEENKTLKEQCQSWQLQLKQYEKQSTKLINEMEYRVSSLKKDNSRLIDEKCYEKSKNTFLETQIKRSTPVRDVRSSSTYVVGTPKRNRYGKQSVLREIDLINHYY
ncbi:unnamed protein product [Paramecium octaurelia]|uniref:Uncharacterized protein n=1 Tax=Paramecium octaurelia TaxID=43137 RepID=A0A8S1VCS4_PAROT|nr:unnamed protein product [Paramecium octaurelia]